MTSNIVMDDSTLSIRCHYEVLNVSQDANDDAIKQAYRRLALQLHPDKNVGNESIVREFRLVQEAYECLSDPHERLWYDRHRDAILKGWSGPGTNGDVPDDMLFDVVPYQHPSCYSGYGDSDERSFYNVYRRVFDAIAREEHELDLPRDFGNSTSEWSRVTEFYQHWESFSSTLHYAWADVYRESSDDRRRVRRAAADENKKARRAAKRERNADVLALVHFCKRRDPRVKRFWQQREASQTLEKQRQRREAERQKAQTRLEREEWKRQAQVEMEEAEKRDLAAGRVRLADLDSSNEEEEEDGRKKKKKKKNRKKKKRGKKKKNRHVSSHEEEQQQQAEPTSTNSTPQANGEQKETATDENDMDGLNGAGMDEDSSALQNGSNDHEAPKEQLPSSSEEEEEEEPDVWRCVACRKDFKSQGQMENHLKSKKHKEAYKKYEKKLEKEAIMQGMMEDLDVAGGE